MKNTFISQLTLSFVCRIEPGDIDNSPLVEKIISNDCVQLKPNLRSGIHFEMVPELLWIFLRKYYRCNGPIIRRKVVFKRKLNQPELDLYPVSLVYSFVSMIFLRFASRRSLSKSIEMRHLCLNKRKRIILNLHLWVIHC